uniref:Uncharacterized protein n=1 Tax=Calidris pygmaea TaxID=425635 RepID=A0A8C3JSF3_9CHAR
MPPGAVARACSPSYSGVRYNSLPRCRSPEPSQGPTRAVPAGSARLPGVGWG